MMNLKDKTYHPVLFAIFPILYLYAVNHQDIRIGVAMLTIFFVAFLTLVIWEIFNFIFKNSHTGKNAILISIYIILFFSYGQLYSYLSSHGIVIKHRWFLPIWLSFYLIATGFILKIKSQNEIIKMSTIFNAVSLFLVIINLIIYSPNIFRKETVLGGIDVKNNNIRSYPESKERYPHIYCIILDSYASNYSLNKFFNYDNAEFTDWLTERGFIVPYRKYSNYPFTALSIPSTLNMQYIHRLISVDKKEKSLEALKKLWIDNQVIRNLKSRGYNIVNLSDEWALSNQQFFSNFADFIHLILNTSPLMRFSQIFLLDKFLREEILYKLDNITRAKSEDKPTFCFAHILCPHPPFLFKKNGNELSIKERLNLITDSYKQGRIAYIEQISFLNEKLKAIIDRLIPASDRPVVIILLADHGPAYISDLSLDSPYTASAKLPNINFLSEQFGIFSAIYASSEIKREFSLSKTSINFFRLLFNHYFNTNFTKLEETIYYSTGKHPYDFVDVTFIGED